MTLRSQNGWPVLEKCPPGFVLKFKSGPSRTFHLRPGHTALILLHYIDWHHSKIGPINTGILDDWSWAVRDVRGSTTDISNHSSGTAVDIDATKHPLGKVGTFLFTVKTKLGVKTTAADRIKKRLRKKYKGVIRWGGEYHGRKDEMHFEIISKIGDGQAARLAKRLKRTARGRKILKQNPGIYA